MAKKLTVLFVGLGSIGTRHIRNLDHLCKEKGIDLYIDALRHDLTVPLRSGVEELLANQLLDLDDDDALPYYDIVFITNPTALHAEILEQVKDRAGALFIEKPIVSRDQIYTKIQKLVNPGQKAYVAAPMRWSKVFMETKDYLDEHPDKHPFSARAICSSYLPDWRPGVDYRKVYSANEEMGGGVDIDLIHEWDYLVYLFGMPQKTFNLRGKFSDLEITSNDLSVYIAKYPELLVELHLDYFGRKQQRYLELYFSDGTLIADFIEHKITFPDGTVTHYEENTNDWYLREMDYFLDYVTFLDGDSINPPKEALNVLEVSAGIYSSWNKEVDDER